MNHIILYTKANCPYCHLAKELLAARQLKFEEIRIDLDETKREEMLQRNGGKRTVPQIFINDQPIGGYEDLAVLVKSGKLDSLLKSESKG